MSDYLSDEEQMDALKQWWQSNGTLLIVGIVVVLSAVIGWRFYQSYVEEQIAASSDLYEAYLAEEVNTAARTKIADELGERFPGSSYHSFALLHEAQAAVSADELDRADELLSTVVAQAKESSVQDLALLRKARILQQLEKSDAVLEVLAEVKGEGFRSQVAEIRGDLHVIAGEREAAFDAYSAALAAVENTAERPLLKMKVENTAPPQVAAAASTPPAGLVVEDGLEGAAPEAESPEPEATEPETPRPETDTVASDAIESLADEASNVVPEDGEAPVEVEGDVDTEAVEAIADEIKADVGTDENADG